MAAEPEGDEGGAPQAHARARRVEQPEDAEGSDR